MPIRHQFNSEEEWLEHLRIWFAGQALVGILSGLAMGAKDEPNRAMFLSQCAYEMADAMLAERSKP